VEEALRFSSAGLAASGLAFDAVSGRFLFGAQTGRKVVIVAEQSTRAVDLVRADSAGFFDVLALEIDARRGDLWVASADLDDGPGEASRAAIHKLQLVSGRPLATIPVPADSGTVRFSDLAVSSDGMVIAVDREGRRLFRLSPGARTLETVAVLRWEHPVSVTLSSDGRRAYVAHGQGLARVDLATGEGHDVEAEAGIAASGLERVRWHEGSLVAVQRRADGTREIVRFRLDRSGGRLMAVEPIETVLAGQATTVATLWNDDFFYVAEGSRPEASSEGAAHETVVRRVRLR
jgi:streptogramin lyase